MKNIAIITARGGSKRIPHKNIKLFCGKPIIAYSIETAIASDLFDEVMVSTDDVEIKKIAEEYGAKVPFMRSASTANDYASTHEVVIEVLDEYRKRGMEYDYVCCMYPTAPFVTTSDLQQSMQMLQQGSADGVIPIVSYSFPPQRCFVRKGDYICYKWPENRLVRSQDLETFYHDAGQFYFLNISEFLKQKTMVLDNTVPFIMDEMRVQDIDNLEDWKLAELKFRMRKE